MQRLAGQPRDLQPNLGVLQPADRAGSNRFILPGRHLSTASMPIADLRRCLGSARRAAGLNSR